VRRGGVGVPFYRVGGRAGWPDGKGIGWPVVGRYYWPSGLVGRVDRGGGWGVWHCFWERRGRRGGVR
jgi:hypothetical protein